MASDVELTQFGDKELRVARGKTSEGDWCIPIFLIFYRSQNREFAKIAPAVGLNADQAQYLAYHFQSSNEWKRTDCFLVDRRGLSKLTERVHGITPAYYFKWPGVDMPETPLKLKVNGEDIQPDIPDEVEDFLEYVHKKRYIDRNVLRVAWTAVAKEAATWMLKKKRPINLGFVKIYAVPYRANWKEILLAKFPKAWWWFGRSREFEDEVKTELVTLEMMAISKSDRCVRWTIEAEATDELEKDMLEMEAAKKAAGETNYVKVYEKTVFEMSDTIMEVFRSWLTKISLPFPQILSGSWEGSKKFTPYQGRKKYLPEIGVNIPVRVIVDKDPPRLGSKSESASMVVRPKAFSLPKMPHLLSVHDAVSGPNGDVDDGHGDSGANGVLMPHASQSTPVECELLDSRTDPGSEPVADGTERRPDI